MGQAIVVNQAAFDIGLARWQTDWLNRSGRVRPPVKMAPGMFFTLHIFLAQAGPAMV